MFALIDEGLSLDWFPCWEIYCARASKRELQACLPGGAAPRPSRGRCPGESWGRCAHAPRECHARLRDVAHAPEHCLRANFERFLCFVCSVLGAGLVIMIWEIVSTFNLWLRRNFEEQICFRVYKNFFLNRRKKKRKGRRRKFAETTK